MSLLSLATSCTTTARANISIIKMLLNSLNYLIYNFFSGHLSSQCNIDSILLIICNTFTCLVYWLKTTIFIRGKNFLRTSIRSTAWSSPWCLAFTLLLTSSLSMLRITNTRSGPSLDLKHLLASKASSHPVCPIST